MRILLTRKNHEKNRETLFIFKLSSRSPFNLTRFFYKKCQTPILILILLFLWTDRRNTCRKNPCNKNPCRKNHCQKDSCEKNTCEKNHCQNKITANKNPCRKKYLQKKYLQEQNTCGWKSLQYSTFWIDQKYIPMPCFWSQIKPRMKIYSFLSKKVAINLYICLQSCQYTLN